MPTGFLNVWVFSMARVVHTLIKELVEAGGATDEEDKEDDQSKEDNISRIQNKKKTKKKEHNRQE